MTRISALGPITPGPVSQACAAAGVARVGVAALAVLAGAPGLAAAAADPPPAVRFDVPAQPVSDALLQLCLRAGCSFALMVEDAATLRSSRVDGDFTWEQALDVLLQGTGLAYQRVGADAVRIYRPFDAPPELPPETVTIWGSYSGGARAALEIESGADRIVDSVSAARIGDFPAANVAEAMQRLPGVSVSREAGEGQFVSVRGLGPLFQSVTFNGAPMAFNENIRNSDQSGRQFQFRVIPPDLISGVVMTKTPTADLIDGGIGSMIDIRTGKPLEIAPFATARVFAHHEERTGEATPNGSLLASWRNDEQTVGVMGGVSYQTRNVQFDRFQHFGFTNVVIDGQTVAAPNEVALTAEQEDRERVSFLGGAQWRPGDDLTISAEALYSTFRNGITEDRISFLWGGDPLLASSLQPGSAVVRNGVLYGGTALRGEIIRHAEFSEQDHDNLHARLNVAWQAGDWRIEPTLSYSIARSALDRPLQRIDGRARSVNGEFAYSFAYGDDPVGDRKVASVLTTLDLGDPQTTVFNRFRIRPTESRDDDATWLVNAARPLDLALGGMSIDRLDLGAQTSDRGRDYQRRDRELSPLASSLFDPVAGTRRPAPGNAFDTAVDRRFSGWTSYDIGAFSPAFEVRGEFPGTAPDVDDLVPTGADQQQSYRVNEDIGALYARLDFSSRFLDRPLTGNAGLRWSHTRTQVRGVQLAADTGPGGETVTRAEPRLFDTSYAELLPSLNINLALSQALNLRLAASRTLTRPSLADLRTATVPNSAFLFDVYDRGQAAIDQSTPSSRIAVGGNPNLKPYLAVNLDASLEWRFADFGGLTVALFDKDIDNFVGSFGRFERLVFNTRSGQSIPVDVLVTRPQNMGSASITGAEIAFSGRTESGFGLTASVTLTDSAGAINTPSDRLSTRLQGASDAIYAFSPFFERGPFEAQASYTWRSDVVTNGNITPGSNAVTNGAEAIIAAGFGTLDLGASYAIRDSVEMFVEASNLLDERQAVYQGDESRPYQIHEFGRSFNFGVRATF
jgi:iron complex outermembrane receptor protein